MTDLSEVVLAHLDEFLLARLDEEERDALACAKVYPSPWEVSDRGWTAGVIADKPYYLDVTRLEQDQAPDHHLSGSLWLGDSLRHIAHHDPATVLLKIEANRIIIKECAFEIDRKPVSPRAVWLAQYTLKVMAVPYAEHSDYLQEWKP